MSKFLWGLYLFFTFLATLPISWLLLSKADFAYPFLYEQIGVAEHIERYAPKNNKSKFGFELTSKDERLKLFHQVSQSIQNHGRGLAELRYQGQNNQTIQLFTPAEITHLQDVANLLDKLKPLSITLVILWLGVSLVLLLKKVRLPSTKQWLVSAFALVLVIGAILALGPERIFNQLHIWVFPDNHQWFFYYEESLMSTMMKAPDLFGFIAAILGLVSVFLSVLLLALVNKISKSQLREYHNK